MSPQTVLFWISLKLIVLSWYKNGTLSFENFTSISMNNEIINPLLGSSFQKKVYNWKITPNALNPKLLEVFLKRIIILPWFFWLYFSSCHVLLCIWSVSATMPWLTWDGLPLTRSFWNETPWLLLQQQEELGRLDKRFPERDAWMKIIDRTHGDSGKCDDFLGLQVINFSLVQTCNRVDFVKRVWL